MNTGDVAEIIISMNSDMSDMEVGDDTDTNCMDSDNLLDLSHDNDDYVLNIQIQPYAMLQNC